MAKPNRKSEEAFYDIFADMTPEDQVIAMRILEQTHRLAKRAAKKTPAEGFDFGPKTGTFAEKAPIAGPSSEASARLDYDMREPEAK